MSRFTMAIGFGLIVVSLACPVRAEVPVAPPPRVVPDPVELVKELGGDEFSEREAAGEKLRALGQKAVPALAAGTRSTDPEIARRSADLLKTIERDARAAFLASFDPDRPAPDHRVWTRFKQLAGEDRAARVLFVEIIRDHQRFARMDQMTGSPPMERDAYHRMLIDVLNAQGAWRGREPTPTPVPGNSVGEIGFLLYAAACTGGDADNVISQRGWQVFGRPVIRKRYDFRPRLPTKQETDADARARDEVHPALLRFLLGWVEARQDPSMVGLMFEDARLFAAPEFLPLARKWAADPKALPAVRVAALRVMGTIGEPATDLPILRALFTDTTVVDEWHFSFDKKLRVVTQIRDVALGMALLRLGEKPAEYGFLATELMPRESQRDPLDKHALGFLTEQMRERTHRSAAALVEARLRPGGEKSPVGKPPAVAVANEMFAFVAADIQQMADVQKFQQTLTRVKARRDAFAEQLKGYAADYPDRPKWEEQLRSLDAELSKAEAILSSNAEASRVATERVRTRVIERLEVLGPAAKPALRDAAKDKDARIAATAAAAIDHIRHKQLLARFTEFAGKDHGPAGDLFADILGVKGAAERLEAIDDATQDPVQVHAAWRGELAARFAKSPKDVTPPEVAAWLLSGCFPAAKSNKASGAVFAFLDPTRNPALAKAVASRPFRRLVQEWAANHAKDTDAARAAAQLLKVAPK